MQQSAVFARPHLAAALGEHQPAEDLPSQQRLGVVEPGLMQLAAGDAQVVAQPQCAAIRARLGELGHSLYKGELGVALLAADLDHPEQACMPFFGDEGWPGHQRTPHRVP